jgi:hypothetical protein
MLSTSEIYNNEPEARATNPRLVESENTGQNPYEITVIRIEPVE